MRSSHVIAKYPRETKRVSHKCQWNVRLTRHTWTDLDTKFRIGGSGHDRAQQTCSFQDERCISISFFFFFFLLLGTFFRNESNNETDIHLHSYMLVVWTEERRCVYNFHRKFFINTRSSLVSLDFKIRCIRFILFQNYSFVSFSRFRFFLFFLFFFFRIRGKFWWFRVNAFQLATVSNKRKRVRRPLQRRLSKQCLYLHEWTLKDSLRLYDTRDQHADPPHVTRSFDSTRAQTPSSRACVHAYTCIAPLICRCTVSGCSVCIAMPRSFFPRSRPKSLISPRFFSNLSKISLSLLEER